MPLKFACPACDKDLVAPFLAAGHTGSCKFCHARIVAPTAAGQPAFMAPDPADPLGVATGHASAAYTPPGTIPMPPPDVLAHPAVGKAFLAAGRPAVADFWKRFLGFGIDMLLITGIQLALAALMLRGDETRPTDVLLATRAELGAAMTYTLTIFGAAVLYGAVFEGSPLQATPGKLVLGMKVCTEHGEPIGYLHALWRNFCKWITVSIVSFVPFIGVFPYAIFFYAMRDDLPQTLHDMSASTLVAERSY
jgi:uncharacterized RDD family membrane protein YckC